VASWTYVVVFTESSLAEQTTPTAGLLSDAAVSVSGISFVDKDLDTLELGGDVSWVSHHQEERKQSGVQDYRKLNKAALKNKVIDSRKLTDFRRNNSAPLLLSNPTGPPPKVFPSEVVPSFTYGKKTRPSTPIAQVVSNQFAAEYQASLEEIYDYYETEKKNKKAPVIRTTKAAEGHARKFLEMEKPPPKEKFILSRFKNIPGKLHLPGGKTLSKSATAPKQITVQPAATGDANVLSMD
jgi:hypothetical protein